MALPGEVSGRAAHFEHRGSAGFCGDPPDVVRGDHGETEAGDVGAAADAVQDVFAVVAGVFVAAGRFQRALAHGVEERCAQGFVRVFGRLQRVLQDLVRVCSSRRICRFISALKLMLAKLMAKLLLGGLLPRGG